LGDNDSNVSLFNKGDVNLHSAKEMNIMRRELELRKRVLKVSNDRKG